MLGSAGLTTVSSMELARLLAGQGMHRGTGGTDDLALLHRPDLTLFLTHLEQIGRNEFIARQFCIGGGKGRVGAGLVAIDIALRQGRRPAAAFAVKHFPVAETVS